MEMILLFELEPQESPTVNITDYSDNGKTVNIW